MTLVRRNLDAAVRKRDFILCRYLLILSAATVGIIESFGAFFFGVVMVVCLELLSNVYAQTMDALDFYDMMTQSVFIVVDTTAVFAILLISGAGQSISIPYFVVMILCAVLDRGVVIAPLVSVVIVASVFFASSTPLFDPADALARGVFLMAAGVFYWFVVLPEREAKDAPKSLGPSQDRSEVSYQVEEE